MKSKTRTYLLLSVIVLGGAIMKLCHIPYATEVTGVGMIAGIFYQSWLISKLEKKIRELEIKKIKE
ncbi:hypothetical protein LJC16_00820 [Bacteroidales bacterium OttesenSCG-928-C19]|nr:hypothetical protein [Bacteroidales bacterium OttesenSCG-928-C19]